MTYFYIIYEFSLKSNLHNINTLLSQSKMPPVKEEDFLDFPAGTMFWARTKSISELFDLQLDKKDFPEEKGQVDGTIAHAIERLFGIIPAKKGYKVIQVINKD